MKYLDYMRSHEDENLSWCKPYASDAGDHVLIMQEGKLLGIISPEREAFTDDTLTDEALKQFAREVNRDYDAYRGWDDLDIALKAMHEVGCAACPWREDCDAMHEDLYEDDNR